MGAARRSAAVLVLFGLQAATALRAQAPARSYEPGIEVLDYDLTLDLPDSGQTIAGSAVISLRRLARVDTLRLDLVHLRVDSVLVNGRATPFSRSEEALFVPLALIGRADRFKVTVKYTGMPADGLIIRTDSAGRWTGFGDNWPNRARYWIPSVDHPSKKATVTWTVRAPASRTVVANGALMERHELPDVRGGQPRVETRWRESRPIATYLMVIAAAPLVAYDLGQTACGLSALARCVPQMVYVAPEQRAELPGAFARAGDIVRFFAERVGPFPYEKLAHLQSSTRYGGMENASAIFYADRIVRRDAMTEGLIAHETAHQWFGDAVTERDWPHVWLSEGFATYFAALWTQHAHGDSAFHHEMVGIRSAVLADSIAVATRPVIDTIETNLLALLNRNSYQKGAFVLHMLRSMLGDRIFFGALRQYYTTHRDGNALTADLEQAMERASGRDLRWFFDQWLRRPGYPELDVSWRYDPAARRVLFDVTQLKRFGAFRFPLTVLLRDTTGRDRRVTVNVPADDHATFPLPATLGSAPALVEVDPDIELLARVIVHSP